MDSSPFRIRPERTQSFNHHTQIQNKDRKNVILTVLCLDVLFLSDLAFKKIQRRSYIGAHLARGAGAEHVGVRQ